MAKKRKRGERGKRGWTQKKILLLMAETNKPISLGELRRVLDLDKSTVCTHLIRLEQKKFVKNTSEGWVLSVFKPVKEDPYNYTREENLNSNKWMCAWLGFGWTKQQSDKLFKTKWYRTNIKSIWDTPPFESNFQNEFTNWVNKAFELARKYPEIWEKVYFNIVKQPEDPFFFHFLNLQGKNKKIKLPDKLW